MIDVPNALKPPDPTVKIRPVRRIDVPVLHEVCWPDRPVTYVNQLVQRARQIAMHSRGLGVVLVGDAPDSVLGYGQLTLWPHGGEISDLVITSDHRGRGLGTTLIQYLVQAAREMRVSSVEIGVAYANTGALALYRRLGFNDDYSVMIDLGRGPEPVLYLRLDILL
jgi:ribosomal protein S18 acetylase RimI-like enzyme